MIRVDTPEQIIDLLPASGHLRPILQAGMVHGISSLLITPNPGPISVRLPADKGWIVILGDDLYCSQGPSVFPGIKRFVCQADLLAVMSGSAIPDVYAAAARYAIAGSRVVLVETQVPHHEVWKRRVRKLAPTAGYLDAMPRPEAAP